MSSEEGKPLLCGQCYARVEGRTEPDGTKWVRCPDCGEEDTLDNAAREAAGHKVDELFKAGFRNFPSNNGVKVTVTGLPKRRYRFVTEG